MFEKCSSDIDGWQCLNSIQSVLLKATQFNEKVNFQSDIYSTPQML